MYFITENEAPPPNVPLREPPHQLSKSLLKYSMQSDDFSCKFHAQSDDIIAERLRVRLLISCSWLMGYSFDFRPALEMQLVMLKNVIGHTWK